MNTNFNHAWARKNIKHYARFADQALQAKHEEQRYRDFKGYQPINTAKP